MNRQLYTLVVVFISSLWFSLPAAASEKVMLARYQVSDHHVMPISFYSHYKARPRHYRRNHEYNRNDWKHERRHLRRHHHAKHWDRHGRRMRYQNCNGEGRRIQKSRQYSERHHQNDEGLKIGVYYEGYL